MLAHSYLAEEEALRVAQQQAAAGPSSPNPGYTGWTAADSATKEAAARGLEPRHRPSFTRRRAPGHKARKAARKRQKAGRKAAR